MQLESQTYSAKLLLLGEHTILKGSHALAMPFAHYSGRWRVVEDWSQLSALQQDLPAFAVHLTGLRETGSLLTDLDADRFLADLEEGLYFESDIPAGYGLGSSGALCAAIYDRYARAAIGREQSSHYLELRSQLAQMESYFHGASSGTDALVSYIHRPALLLAGGEVEAVRLPAPPADGSFGFFLLDTGRRRQAGAYVKRFLEKCEDAAFYNYLLSGPIPETNLAIQCLLAGQWADLYGHLDAISRFQLDFLPDWIPADFQKIWNEGLKGDLFRLKLCGAGGGGFLLGYSAEVGRAMRMLAAKGYKTEKLTD